MNFASVPFLNFYAVVFALYWAVPANSARKGLLLLASYYFYMSWNPYLIVLIWTSTVLDYSVGWALHRSSDDRVRRGALLVSCVGNLGLLATFKYANFFLDSAHALAEQIGFPIAPYELEIILPVGISFYTFQTLSYTIDLYRREIPVCRSPLDFALFVAFFPQLVAGPIVRAKDFLPQLRLRHRWNWRRLGDGLSRIVIGLAKKVVIADSLAIVADNVFNSPESYGFFGTWFGVLAFTFQIYCDFSAYSDIAIGTAATLGFEIPENFRHPYLAQNVREFWSRWHISLSTWLRDYLYIPLGGNRFGELMTYRNLFITMLLGGLWHGAAWTFVIWGLVHGTLLSLTRALEPRFKGLFEPVNASRLAGMARMAVTFVLICLTWVLFRAQSFGDALSVYRGMVGLEGLFGVATVRASMIWVMLLPVGTHVLSLLAARRGIDWMAPPLVRALVLTGCILGIITFWGNSQEFIYFQF